jgi:hypothetical protein
MSYTQRWGVVDEFTSHINMFRLRNGGLQTLVDGGFYNLRASFTPFSNIGKNLTLSYMMKVTKPISCSSDYITVKASPEGDTLFQFGPDSCDGIFSVRIIVVDSDGIWYINKNIIDPKYRIGVAVKYSLSLNANGSYSVAINDNSVAFGLIYQDFQAYDTDLILSSDKIYSQWNNIGVIGFDGDFEQQAGTVFSNIVLTSK